MVERSARRTAVSQHSMNIDEGTRELEGATIPNLIFKNRYVIEKEIGRGGFGVVYLGRDRELLARQVVVKVLLDRHTDNEWIRRKFQQEIEALTRIDHPGVVGILDAGTSPGGDPFLVMQFIDGIRLRSAMKPGGMSLDRVANVVQQASSALSAAHRRNVVHRDLKPEN